jgi:hypothetical protein
MPGFSSFDDYISERTVNGKEWRQDWVKTTGGSVHAASRWYDHWMQAGNPPAALYSGTAKYFVACDSTPVRITSGTATAASATIATSDTTGLKVGMLVVGSAGTVTIPANAWIASIITNTSFTLNAVTGGSSTGTPDVTCSFPTIWHGGNQSSDKKRILDIGAYMTAAAFGPNNLQLIDVLGYYPLPEADIESTTKRTLNNTITLPRFTNGKGVRAFFVTTVAPLTGGPNLTEFTYVNQDGATRVCPVVPSFGATPIIGHIPHTDAGANKFQFIPLAAGDYGIRSVTSFTLSGGTQYTGTGAMALVLCRPLLTIPLTASAVAAERNTLFQSSGFTEIVDGACLDVLIYAGGATTANTNLNGYCEFAWG